MPFNRPIAHVYDAAWIIELWIAIHGGDPAPDGRINIDDRTVQLVGELTEHLQSTYHPSAPEMSEEDFTERLTSVQLGRAQEQEIQVEDAVGIEGPRLIPRCYFYDGILVICFKSYIPKVQA
jgi:hypothetical protein